MANNEFREIDQFAKVRRKCHQSALGQAKTQDFERLALPDCWVGVNWAPITLLALSCDSELGCELFQRSFHLIPLGQSSCAFLLSLDSILLFKALSLGRNARLKGKVKGDEGKMRVDKGKMKVDEGYELTSSRREWQHDMM